MKFDVIFFIGVISLMVFLTFELFIVNAQDCTEFKVNDRVYVEVINTTNGLHLNSQSCTIDFFNSTHNIQITNATTTEISGSGLYYFTLNASFIPSSYIATIYCNSGVQSYQFCVVSEYTRNINNNIKSIVSNLDTALSGNSSEIQSDVGSLDKNLKANFTFTNNKIALSDNALASNFTIVNTKLDNLDTNLANNFTNSNNKLDNVLGYLNLIDNAVGSNFTEVAENVWDHADRQLTAFGFNVNVTDEVLNNLADITWNYASRSLTDYGTLIADTWDYATRTLTAFVFDVNVTQEVLNNTWDHENRNLTWFPDFVANITNITNDNTITNIDNSTMNIILPVE